MIGLIPPEPWLVPLALGGDLPADLLAQPVYCAHLTTGRVLQFDPTTPDPMEALLAHGGHRWPADEPLPPGRWLSCLAEAVAVAPSAEPRPPVAEVLFAVPDRASLQALVEELLRLGAGELQLCATPHQILVHALEPPYYTVLKALEPGAPWTAHGPVAPGVWLALGYRHPLAPRLQAPLGQLLLLPAQGPWQLVCDGPWRELEAALTIAVPPRQPLLPNPAPPPLTLALALVAAPRSHDPTAPTLWVLRRRALSQLEMLLAALPEAEVAGLGFVASGACDEPTVVLRALQGSPPALEDLEAEVFGATAGVANLYLPRHRRLEPPLLPGTLQRQLAPDAEMVYWLATEAGGALRREAVADGAFAPLSQWVDYWLGAQLTTLEPWLKAWDLAFEVPLAADAPLPAPAATPTSARAEAAVAPPAPPPLPPPPPTPGPSRP